MNCETSKITEWWDRLTDKKKNEAWDKSYKHLGDYGKVRIDDTKVERMYWRASEFLEL